jgi:DNA-binding transcriptional regulator PaaX
LPKLIKYFAWKIKNKTDKKKACDVFSRLCRQGIVRMEYKGRQLHISLTEEGKKKAGKYQIDDLEIKKLKKWDKKWHILIFDIQNKKKIKREALRGKIKELGLYQLQKSVWIYPYDFQKEIVLLRNFFGLTKDEMKTIVASEVEDDKNVRIFFKV